MKLKQKMKKNKKQEEEEDKENNELLVWKTPCFNTGKSLKKRDKKAATKKTLSSFLESIYKKQQ